MKYTDIRGLQVDDKRLEEILAITGKTEHEVVEFLGKEYCEIPGAFFNFIDMMAVQKQYFCMKM